MSSTLPKDGEKVTPPAWDPYPSPPSSGRGAVLLPSGDKRSLTRLTADQCEEDEQGHQAKRARPQQARSALLTPPSTRGRRMADRLTMLDRESGSYLPSSSRRPCGGREARFETWTDEDSQLDTPSAQKQRRLQHKLRTEPYPIRDTAHNPFIEGGPADMGITGPQPYRAPARSAAMHRHESGNMLYVFRGQRVMRPAYDTSYSTEAGLLHSPLKPRLLFPPHANKTVYVMPPRNALSDDDEVPPWINRRPRGLFSQELEARARKSEQPDNPVPAPDPDALWLTTMTHAKPAAPPSNLPHKNVQLIAKLEQVDWSSEGEDSLDD